MIVVGKKMDFVKVWVTHEIDTGYYTLRMTDGEREIKTDKEFHIGFEMPSVSSISISEVMQGKEEKLNIIGEYFSNKKEENNVYLSIEKTLFEIDVLTSTDSNLEVSIPDNLKPGKYTVKVVSRNQSVFYNDEMLKINADTTLPIILSIDESTFYRGDTIRIIGKNLKKSGVATNINFLPFPNGGVTIVRSAVVNDDGTELIFELPSDFETGTYTILVECDFKFSEEYISVIEIKS